MTHLSTYVVEATIIETRRYRVRASCEEHAVRQVRDDGVYSHPLEHEVIHTAIGNTDRWKVYPDCTACDEGYCESHMVGG